MSKINLADLSTITGNETSAINTINNNSTLIETFSDNTLSRDGTTPNHMLDDLDMNSYRVINLPGPSSGSEPLRLQDLSDFIGGGTIVAGAPLNASYVTLGTNASLTSERVLTAGTKIGIVDGGVGSTVTISTTGFTTSTTDNAISRYDGTSGNTQNSGVLIDDSNNLTLPNTSWLKGRNVGNSSDLSMFRVNTANYTEFTNPIFYDNGLGFNDRHALFSVERHITSEPTDIFPNIWSLAQGRGNNTTFVGVAGIDLRAYDNSDINGSTKGVLYGAQIVVNPLITRNNSPFDDVTGINMVNIGTVSATDAYFVGVNPASTIVGAHWDSAFLCGVASTYAFRSTAAHTYGLDFVSNLAATFTQAAIRIPNNTTFVARNNAGNADVVLAKLTTADALQLQGGTFSITSAGVGTLTGNLSVLTGTAVPAGGTTGAGYKLSSTANLGIFFGSGLPTLSAAQGSLYLRTDGSSSTTRLYVNSNGSTTWVNITTPS